MFAQAFRRYQSIILDIMIWLLKQLVNFRIKIITRDHKLEKSVRTVYIPTYNLTFEVIDNLMIE